MNDWYNDPPEDYPDTGAECNPDPAYDTLEEKEKSYGEPIQPALCPHGNQWGECDRCDYEGDIAQRKRALIMKEETQPQQLGNNANKTNPVHWNCVEPIRTTAINAGRWQHNNMVRLYDRNELQSLGAFMTKDGRDKVRFRDLVEETRESWKLCKEKFDENRKEFKYKLCDALRFSFLCHQAGTAYHPGEPVVTYWSHLHADGGELTFKSEDNYYLLLGHCTFNILQVQWKNLSNVRMIQMFVSKQVTVPPSDASLDIELSGIKDLFCNIKQEDQPMV